MTWQQALETVVERTRHERYRELCAESHPAHVDWCAKVVQMAQPATEYPSLWTQATNAAGALGRVAGAVLAGEPVRVDQAEYDRRLAVCRGCEKYDSSRAACTVCGCQMAGVVGKASLATEVCPLGKWKAT